MYIRELIIENNNNVKDYEFNLEEDEMVTIDYVI